MNSLLDWLFLAGQVGLMIEDFLWHSVSPWLCLAVFILALYQGGWPVAIGASISTVCFCPFVHKQYMGIIDAVFIGVYAGLLADASKISLFLMGTGVLGMLFYVFNVLKNKKIKIPLITMMGLGYFLCG